METVMPVLSVIDHWRVIFWLGRPPAVVVVVVVVVVDERAKLSTAEWPGTGSEWLPSVRGKPRISLRRESAVLILSTRLAKETSDGRREIEVLIRDRAGRMEKSRVEMREGPRGARSDEALGRFSSCEAS